ncbi:energy-coupling factor transporter transmembrane component T family protein [Lederbergia galactosidilytica]|uniref:ABC transporter permease n=1 Tax=Lederbergia galactosidilytica TaxID=217031 RepID=A0A177ZLE7_9BACI|nr:energy-coupling factor transporter transmembrane component T [Lederbergia galactosidilytica]MBP1916131.1 energy-coupling factor transport system permease protein [Lederbergia galactosidilytica]OAK68413.1 ABC transporter permease [Lederbergia galactosidilytica]
MQELFTPAKETWLYRVNPALKFVLFFCLLLIVLFQRNLAFVFHLTFLYGILLYGYSGYRWKKLCLFSIPMVLSFISSALTMILFGKGVHVWWSWGLIKISEESFYYGLLLGCKTLCFGIISLTFLLTTRPIMLFYALMQQCKLAPKYAYSFIASIRLLPMIVEELRTRSNALKVRGVHFSKGIKGLFEHLRLYMVPLFAQSIRRAQRVAVAMEAKRFQMGVRRTYYYPTIYTKIDVVFLSAVVVSFLSAHFLKGIIPYKTLTHMLVPALQL